MTSRFVATVQILLDAENSDDALRQVTNLLTHIDAKSPPLDWQFLRLGGQVLFPTARTGLRGIYRHGDFSIQW